MGWVSPGLAALVSFALPPTCSLRSSSISAGPAGSPPPSNCPRPGLRTLPQRVFGRGASSPAALGLYVCVYGCIKSPLPRAPGLAGPPWACHGQSPHTEACSLWGQGRWGTGRKNKARVVWSAAVSLVFSGVSNAINSFQPTKNKKTKKKKETQNFDPVL